MVDRLIEKNGSTITINGEEVKVHIDTHKEALNKVKRSQALPYLTMKSILSLEKIPYNAKIKICGEDFLVYEIIEAPTRKDKIEYYDTVLFKDDFVNDIKIGKQTLSMVNCNLPSDVNTPTETVKAQIRTKKSQDILQYSMQGKIPPTHEFTIFYKDGVKIGDFIEWGQRRFEVISAINIDELNRFLVIDVAEVVA